MAKIKYKITEEWSKSKSWSILIKKC